MPGLVVIALSQWLSPGGNCSPVGHSEMSGGVSFCLFLFFVTTGGRVDARHAAKYPTMDNIVFTTKVFLSPNVSGALAFLSTSFS